MGKPAVILLDTHVVLWLADDSDCLSRAATNAIKKARAEGGLAISSITLFEIAQLIARKRITVGAPMQTFLNAVESRFLVQRIDAPIAVASTQFMDPYPKDPMDRLIGATALVKGVPLVTSDERIRESGQLLTIW